MSNKNMIPQFSPVVSAPVQTEPIKQLTQTKTRNKLLIPLVLTSILAGTGLAFGGYELYQNTQKTNEVTKAQSEIAIVEKEAATSSELDESDADSNKNTQGAVCEINFRPEQYQEVKDILQNILTEIGVTTPYIHASDDMPILVDGLNTYIPSRFMLASEVRTTEDEADGLEEKTKNSLLNNGFESVGELPFWGSAGPQIFGYKKGNISCAFYRDATYSGNYTYYYLNLECAATSWTWLSDSELATLQGIERAYYEKTGSYPYSLYSGYTIKDSQYSPYQTLTIGLGGGLGLFYRTSETSPWVFFMVGQDGPACDDYNTEDLKKAFLGTQCSSDAVVSL